MKPVPKHHRAATPAKDDSGQYTPAGTFPDFKVDTSRCIRWVLDGTKKKHTHVHSGHPLRGSDETDYVIDADEQTEWKLYKLSDVIQVDDNNQPILG
jgi:hypothetical protein